MRLTIREIADLKEGRKSLDEITKTHDGTSLGKISSVMDKWTQSKVGKRDYSSVSFTEDGQIVQGSELRENQLSDLHRMDNSGENGTYTCTRIYENGSVEYQSTDIPHHFIMNDLMDKNKDGEYLNRSISLVSYNGTRMTVVRNNKFNDENHDMFNKTCEDMETASKEYNDMFSERWKARVQEMIDNREFPNKIKGHNLSSPIYLSHYLEHKAKQEVLKDMGTWEQNVLKGQGFDKRFEECNTKFRVSRKYTDNRDWFSRHSDLDWLVHDGHEESFQQGKPVEERNYDWTGAGYVKEVKEWGKGHQILWHLPTEEQ